MINKEDSLKAIVRTLSFLKTMVSELNSLNLYDANINAEYFYCDLLNLAFDLNLKNLNTETINAGYIDLIDRDQKLAIQVTSQNDKAKIEKTIEGFYAKNEYESYKLQLLLIAKDAKEYRTDFTINGKYTFDHKEDVIDITRLLAKIRDLDTDHIKKIEDFLEREVNLNATRDSQKFYPDFFLPDLKFFVGREKLLEQLEATLKTDYRAAIHDISGLGKTFTAYKFAEDNQENYEKIFFIRATREEMLESLAKCGEMVNPGLADVTEQQAKALGFKEWLEENENWLVIYDNVDLPNELFKYVPVSKKGDCLFTSNFREINNLGTEINIVKLDKTDAEILLYSRANNQPHTKRDLNGDERDAFDRLIEEIDGLPLTLNSTGALIAKKQWSFADLWQRYVRSTEILWESEDKYSAYQRRSAGIVFSLAYDELCGTDKIGDAVKILLDSMSFISPDEIPEDLLRKILAARGESFAKTEEQDDRWDDIREKLTAYDLLKYDKHKKTFTTHRAIQRVIQSRLTSKEKDPCIALASVLRGLFPGYDYSNREVCEKYYQHVLVLLENADRFDAETEDINELYFAVGRYQSLLGNYKLAERFHLNAADISAVVFGIESERYSRDLNDLANDYIDQGRYDQAIEKLETVLSISEKTIGREHSHYAVYLVSLGLAYKLQGRYNEAIEKLEEAIRIDEMTIGCEHHDYAIDLNNLGEVYRILGRYDEAIEKFQEALRISEKTVGNDHPNYAVSRSNLGGVYERQGKFAEALELYKNALQIFEKSLPEGHPRIVLVRENVERCGKLID